MAGPLSGVVVLDFTRAVAGAFCTRLLCDMGARVVKIEPPQMGDMTRMMTFDDPIAAKYLLPTISPMFIHSNAGKEAICADLKRPEAIDAIKRMVPKVDVVVENFTPHVMPGLGLGYDELAKLRPDLVMCSVSGFGQEGPLANHVSNDAVGQAMAGMAWLSGKPDGYPVEAGNGIADSITATTAAMAIVSALFYRQQTGEGQYIDVSLMDTVMSVDCNAHPVVAATRGKWTVERDEKGNFLAAPWGVFEGPEGRFFAMLSAWDRLCNLMGRPELIADPRYATNQDRLRNRAEVQEIVEGFLKGFATAEEAFEALREARIAAGPVLSPNEAQTHPQVEGRALVRDIEYPGGTVVPSMATAPRFSKTPIDVGRAPFIGEHNRAVLAELAGLDEAAIERLHADEVFYEDVTVPHLVRASDIEGG